MCFYWIFGLLSVCILLKCVYVLPAEGGRADPGPAESLRLQTVYNWTETADRWTQEWGETFTNKHTHVHVLICKFSCYLSQSLHLYFITFTTHIISGKQCFQWGQIKQTNVVKGINNPICIDTRSFETIQNEHLFFEAFSFFDSGLVRQFLIGVCPPQSSRSRHSCILFIYSEFTAALFTANAANSMHVSGFVSLKIEHKTM